MRECFAYRFLQKIRIRRVIFVSVDGSASDERDKRARVLRPVLATVLERSAGDGNGLDR